MTKTNFLEFILKNIGQLSVGQTPSATDTSAATVVYEAVYEQLQQESLVAWGIDGDIPEWAVISLKKIVSPELAREFNLPEEKIMLLRQDAIAGMGSLLRNINQDYQSETTPAEYF